MTHGILHETQITISFTSFQLQLVDAKDIDAIFENKGWWTDYYKK